MLRSFYEESADQALQEIESRVEELTHYCPTIRVHTVKAMQKPRAPWVHQLTMIAPSIGPNGPGRVGSFRYPNVALLEEWIEPRQLIDYLKAIRDNTARVGNEVLDRQGDGVFNDSEYFPGNNRYSTYPGRLYKTSGRPEHVYNVEHLIAPGQPYYSDLGHAIREWTGVPVEIGRADGFVGNVMFFMPECGAHIQSLVRNEDVIDVTLALGPTAVKDLRVVGGWREGERWKAFDKLVITTGENLQFEVPRSAEELNIHVIGGDGRWYDYHLESRGRCIGQERVLDSTCSKPIDVRTLEDALQQGEGASNEFKEYIKKKDPKEADIVKSVVALANTEGGTIYIGVSDECELIGTDADLCKAFPGEGADLEKALADYIGYLKSMLPAKMNHCPSLEYQIVRTDAHRILAITVAEGVDRIYSQNEGTRILVRRGASCVRADADHDIPRLARERLGRQWQAGDAMDW